jgi:RNA polymerase sigma factor (sigma-70 family)
LLRDGWDQLLLAARQGNGSSLVRLLELASEDLRRTARRFVGRGQTRGVVADDAFADALVTVLREIGTLRATNYVGFRYWFASIARNQARQRLRSTRNEPRLDLDGMLDLPRRERPPLGDDFTRVRHTMERLPRAQQVAYALREGLALSWHTIAFVLERRTTPAARLVHYRATGKARGVPAIPPQPKRASGGSIHEGGCTPSASR